MELPDLQMVLRMLGVRDIQIEQLSEQLAAVQAELAALKAKALEP